MRNLHSSMLAAVFSLFILIPRCYAYTYGAVADFSVDNIDYVIVSDQAVKAVGLRDKSATSNLKIPSKVTYKYEYYDYDDLDDDGNPRYRHKQKTYSVVMIGSSAFYNCTSLTRVTVSGEIEISGADFSSCTSLVQVEMPSVRYIGDRAFANCTSLESVTSSSATTVGSYAFNACRSIADVTMPNVTDVGAAAFYNCTSLSDVYLPKAVSLGTSSFCNCTSLKSIDMSNAETIGASAFCNCTSLTDVDLSGATTIENSSFQNCDSLSSVRLPVATSLGESAFESCENLMNVYIGPALFSGAESAFLHCPNLLEFSVSSANKVYSACNGLLCNKSETEVLLCPCAIKSLEVPSTVETIGYGLFSGLENLLTVTIPKGVKTIGPYAFSYCPLLKTIDIPSSVESIEKYAFYGCSGLECVNVSAGLKSIGESAFEGCENLEKMEFPRGLRSIGYFALAYTGLQEIEIPSSVVSIDNMVFYRCINLKKANVKAAVASIGTGLFEDCVALNELTLPNTLSTIGPYAFCGCSSLKEVLFPSGLTEIEEYAFAWSGMERVNLPDGTAAVGPYAFAGSGLQDVSIPDSVEEIGLGAFSYSPISQVEVSASNPWYFTSGGVLSDKEQGILLQLPSSISEIRLSGHIRSIDATAFSSAENLRKIAFLDAPPAVLAYQWYSDDLAFPDTEPIGTYLSTYKDAWAAVIDNGYWHGIKMEMVEPVAEAEVVVNFRKEDGEQDTSCDKAYWLCPLGDDGYTPLPVLNGVACEMPVGTHTLNLYSGETAFADPEPITVTVDGTKERIEIDVVVKRKVVHFNCIFYNTAQKDYGMLPNSLGMDSYCKWSILGKWLTSGQGIDIPTGDYILELEIDSRIRLMASTDLLQMPISLDGTEDNAVCYVNALGDGGAKVAFNFKGHSTNADTPPAFDLSKVYVTLRNAAGDEMTVGADEYSLPQGAYTASFAYHSGDGTIPWIAPDDISFTINGTDKTYSLNFIDAEDSLRFVRVYFNANGGTVDATSLKYAYRGDRTPINIFPVPQRDDAEFQGWYTQRRGGRWVCGPEHSGFVPLSGDGDIELVGPDGVAAGNYAIRLYAHWKGIDSQSGLKIWLEDAFPSLFAKAGGDVATASAMMAANGCRTVGECYALGIDPEDPNDDFKIIDFKMENGKPTITVNHTEDGSGESFLPRVRTLGKAELLDEWQEVPPEGNPNHRFFTVTVDMP